MNFILNRDIRDRSILRLYETDGMMGLPMSFPSTLPLPMGIPTAAYGHGMPPMPVAAGLHSPMITHSPPSNSWDPESSYFSEPEFDSDYQSQHVHKTKVLVQFILLCSAFLRMPRNSNEID